MRRKARRDAADTRHHIIWKEMEPPFLPSSAGSRANDFIQQDR